MADIDASFEELPDEAKSGLTEAGSFYVDAAGNTHQVSDELSDEEFQRLAQDAATRDVEAQNVATEIELDTAKNLRTAGKLPPRSALENVMHSIGEFADSPVKKLTETGESVLDFFRGPTEVPPKTSEDKIIEEQLIKRGILDPAARLDLTGEKADRFIGTAVFGEGGSFLSDSITRMAVARGDTAEIQADILSNMAPSMKPRVINDPFSKSDDFPRGKPMIVVTDVNGDIRTWNGDIFSAGTMMDTLGWVSTLEGMFSVGADAATFTFTRGQGAVARSLAGQSVNRFARAIPGGTGTIKTARAMLEGAVVSGSAGLGHFFDEQIDNQLVSEDRKKSYAQIVAESQAVATETFGFDMFLRGGLASGKFLLDARRRMLRVDPEMDLAALTAWDVLNLPLQLVSHSNPVARVRLNMVEQQTAFGARAQLNDSNELYRGLRKGFQKILSESGSTSVSDPNMISRFTADAIRDLRRISHHLDGTSNFVDKEVREGFLAVERLGTVDRHNKIIALSEETQDLGLSVDVSTLKNRLSGKDPIFKNVKSLASQEGLLARFKDPELRAKVRSGQLRIDQIPAKDLKQLGDGTVTLAEIQDVGLQNLVTSIRELPDNLNKFTDESGALNYPLEQFIRMRWHARNLMKKYDDPDAGRALIEINNELDNVLDDLRTQGNPEFRSRLNKTLAEIDDLDILTDTMTVQNILSNFDPDALIAEMARPGNAGMFELLKSNLQRTGHTKSWQQVTGLFEKNLVDSGPDMIVDMLTSGNEQAERFMKVMIPEQGRRDQLLDIARSQYKNKEFLTGLMAHTGEMADQAEDIMVGVSTNQIDIGVLQRFVATLPGGKDSADHMVLQVAVMTNMLQKSLRKQGSQIVVDVNQFKALIDEIDKPLDLLATPGQERSILDEFFSDRIAEGLRASSTVMSNLVRKSDAGASIALAELAKASQPGVLVTQPIRFARAKQVQFGNYITALILANGTRQGRKRLTSPDIWRNSPDALRTFARELRISIQEARENAREIGVEGHADDRTVVRPINSLPGNEAEMEPILGVMGMIQEGAPPTMPADFRGTNF